MRILQVIHSFPPHNFLGTEVYAYHLCKELAKRHHIFIFHRVNELGKKDYEIYHNNYDGLEVYAINNTFKNYNGFEAVYKNEGISNKFSTIIDQIKPDIVHIQHLLYLSTSIINEIKKRHIPIVFTLHDYWLICPQGQLLKSNFNICDNNDYSECINCILYQLSIKKNIFNYYYYLKKFVPESLLQLIKRNYFNYAKASFLSQEEAFRQINKRAKHIKDICANIDLFIAPSEFIRNKFIEFGVSEDKIIFSGYGFNLDNFKDTQKIPSDKIRFAFIGNIMPAKGIHYLIDAFNKIKNDNVELRIYGRVMSYKAILENYLNYIKKIVKNRNIKFMGGFDNKDVANIFRQTDVLIVPSIWHENSPLVIQEAFATGTPVIASRIGGIPELIEDGINGILFEPNDVADLCRKIVMFIENPSLIEEIKRNIKLPKSIGENAREIENIYEELLATAKVY
jgi:glycosyltransferase involved in cell wall biosynthesis